MNDPWVVAGKIAEALDALNGNPELHGVSALREEIARLKAINAKLEGVSTTKTVEISNLRKTKKKLSDDLDELREAQTRGGQAVELQRQHEEIRDLREDLHFKEIEIKELKASLERKDKAAIQISKNNASLREQLEYQTKASRRHQSIADELAGVVNEVRRALNDYDK